MSISVPNISEAELIILSHLGKQQKDYNKHLKLEIGLQNKHMMKN